MGQYRFSSAMQVRLSQSYLHIHLNLKFWISEDIRAAFHENLNAFICLYWKMRILRSKSVDFGVILNDFIVNYDVLCDFRCLRESSRSGLRRSGTKNRQNENLFRWLCGRCAGKPVETIRSNIKTNLSWAALEKLKFYVSEGLRGEFA